jgi:hypothetical protein
VRDTKSELGDDRFEVFAGNDERAVLRGVELADESMETGASASRAVVRAGNVAYRELNLLSELRASRHALRRL